MNVVPDQRLHLNLAVSTLCLVKRSAISLLDLFGFIGDDQPQRSRLVAMTITTCCLARANFFS